MTSATPPRPLRFLFVGGGTGGHLAPALGLAERLEARGHRTCFLGSGRAAEQSFFRGERPYHSLGLERNRRSRALAWLPAARRARQLARSFEPDLVVGLGGFAGTTALLARRGRPLVLLEGNRVPGRGVRMLQPWSRATLTLFADTARDLRRGRCIGPVGRSALQGAGRAAARRHLGLDAQRPALLLMGGSQGARALNQLTAGLAPGLAAAGAQLLALVGPEKAGDLREACDAAGLPAVVLEHCREMGRAYSASDLALSRGGAATVAELWLHALPAVVVPYPHHRDRQQERNALCLAPGLEVVAESEPERIAARVLALLDSPERRGAMAHHLRASAPADGVDAGAGLLEEIALENG